MSDPKEIPFQRVIDALLNDSQVFSTAYLYRLSNLDGGERNLIEKNWYSISPQRRRSILADFEHFSEIDPLLDFSEICQVSVRDSDPEVRLLSIRVLWAEQSISHARMLIEVGRGDENLDVRAAAISCLSSYVYLGEIEEISADLYREIEMLLAEVLRKNEHPLLYRCALESIGYCGKSEYVRMIKSAFEKDDDDFIASALIAMGRSADPHWSQQVMEMLDYDNPLIREEAARAAGELELEQALPALLDNLEDDEPPVRSATIWAISQIGGKGAREVLDQLLEECEDDSEVELIEEALENLTFNEGLGDLDLFNFDDDFIDEE